MHSGYFAVYRAHTQATTTVSFFLARIVLRTCGVELAFPVRAYYVSTQLRRVCVDYSTLPYARRVKIGFESRPGAEAEGRRALARWESVLKAEDMDEEACKIERKAVEKLEVLLKASDQRDTREKRYRVAKVFWNSFA